MTNKHNLEIEIENATDLRESERDTATRGMLVCVVLRYQERYKLEFGKYYELRRGVESC